MDDLIFIFPRESFLLGLCSGEYEQRQRNEEPVEFISIIKNRLLPFIEPFGLEQEIRQVTLADIPPDIVWTELSGIRFGYAKSQPNAFYECYGLPEKPGEEMATSNISGFRTVWNPSQRNSLVELLIRSLARFMQLSLRDHWSVGNTHDPESVVAAFHQWRVAAIKDGWEAAEAERRGKEYPPTIQKTLATLVERSGSKSLFNIGQFFGSIVCQLEAFSRYVVCEDFEKGEAYKTLNNQIRIAIKELLKCDMVQQNHYAKSALNDIILSTTDKTLSWDELPETIASRHLMNIWIAIGELLGVLRDADEVALARDASSAIPRTFVSVDVNDPPDRIRLRLQQAEKNLTVELGKEGSAEYNLSAVFPAIEALMKRVWANEVRQGEIVLLLKSAIGNPKSSELRKRFANAALSLHLAYRNQAAHEMDGFRCSYDEARYFIAGIRVLLDLSERILTQEAPANS